MATAQLGPIATDFGIAHVPVSLVGITLPALTFALSIDRVLNGVTRPFFGWVSDRLGREQTMFLAFFAEGVGIVLHLLDQVHGLRRALAEVLKSAHPTAGTSDGEDAGL